MKEEEREMSWAELRAGDQRDKVVAWKKNGKGKGYRWMLQRDLVATLSLVPLTSTGIQGVMALRHGMSNPTTFKFLSELRSAGALEQFLEAEKGYYWRATHKGVSVYLRHRNAIPAMLAEELLSLASVNESEESNHPNF